MAEEAKGTRGTNTTGTGFQTRESLFAVVVLLIAGGEGENREFLERKASTIIALMRRDVED